MFASRSLKTRTVDDDGDALALLHSAFPEAYVQMDQAMQDFDFGAALEGLQGFVGATV
jgi:hypothetical protein